jgi:hypothetical protein
MHNGKSQENFPWIKDKYLRSTVSFDKGFYIVTSKDYDRDIDILNSYDQTFNASIERSLEPKIIKMFDIMLIEPKNKNDPNDKG